MKKFETLVLEKRAVISFIEFAVLTGIAFFAPLFRFQAITGSIVNAVLFVAAVLLGWRAGVLIGLIPSIIALGVGTLPSALAPLVPCIILSNAILVVVFTVLKRRNYWLGIIFAAVLKFAFLWGVSSLIVGFILKGTAVQVAVIMGWPQLFTALAGGFIAYLFLSAVGRRNF